MRGFIVVIVCLLAHPLSTSAEVTSVTISSRTILAGGQPFGSTGSYERLVGRIEFALDPADPHNAGIVDLRSLEKLDEAAFDRSLSINFKGPFFLIQALLPIFADPASIVLNTSVNAHIGMANTTIYAASKAA